MIDDTLWRMKGEERVNEFRRVIESRLNDEEKVKFDWFMRNTDIESWLDSVCRGRIMSILHQLSRRSRNMFYRLLQCGVDIKHVVFEEIKRSGETFHTRLVNLVGDNTNCLIECFGDHCDIIYTNEFLDFIQSNPEINDEVVVDYKCRILNFGDLHFVEQMREAIQDVDVWMNKLEQFKFTKRQRGRGITPIETTENVM